MLYGHVQYIPKRIKMIGTNKTSTKTLALLKNLKELKNVNRLGK